MTTPGHSPVSRPLYHKLLGETARVHWQELERLFAQGKLLLVAAELDLVVVAEAIASDDARRVAAWVASGQLQNLPASRSYGRWLSPPGCVCSNVTEPGVIEH